MIKYVSIYHYLNFENIQIFQNLLNLENNTAHLIKFIRISISVIKL